MDSLWSAISFLFLWAIVTVIVFIFVGVFIGTPLLNKYEGDEKKKNKAMLICLAISAFIALVGMFYYKLM